MFISAGKSTILFCFILLVFSSFAFFSCTTVKNFPVNRPFVYETNINVGGDFKPTERKNLEDQLEQQLHDSIRAHSVNILFGVKRWVPRAFYREIVNPQVYDSVNADKSVIYMRALLHSLGYTGDTISYHASIDTVKKGQLQTTVNFDVYPGKLIRIDSIRYNLFSDTIAASARFKEALDTLQQITNRSLNESVIKKGDPFSKYALSAERDRLADVYRNNGYLQYSQEEMLLLWDTVGINLLRPTLDPIEQARLLSELAERRKNPKVDVEFRLRTNTDSSRIIRYYIGNITVYPDLTPDTALYRRTEKTIGDYRFISYKKLFRPEKLTDYIFLHRGDLYRQNKALQTQNKLASLNTWRPVTVNQIPRAGQDTVDIEIGMMPAKKYAFSANLEGSRNQENIALAEGNLIGLGVTLGLRNRNFAHAANQSNFNLRYGIELNANTGNLVQTQQFNLNYTITFPRLVPHIGWLQDSTRNGDVRTIFASNFGVIDRVDYYYLNTFSTSWGFEKSWNNKILTIRIPNIEYNLLVKRDLLNLLIDSNRSYKYIFNTGFIVSTLVNLSIAHSGKSITKLTSASIELPLLPFNLRSDLYRFIKVDAEHRETYTIHRSAFAWRVFGGVGIGIPFSLTDSINRYLPFFRAYYAGGPNSMRAWAIRKLGPGSAIRSFSAKDAPDRFGDMRLEANAEYRFYIATYNGVVINSALFTDIGNVWFLRANPDFPGGEFSLSKLGKDIAIGVGTGLRVDFGFLKVRLDYSYKMKDPSPENAAGQNKLFYDWHPLKGQLQLGIDYPF